MHIVKLLKKPLEHPTLVKVSMTLTKHARLNYKSTLYNIELKKQKALERKSYQQ